MLDKYNLFRDSISEKEALNNALDRYKKRLDMVAVSRQIGRGLSAASEIRRICQKVLFEEGLTYVWLVPLETSINEYSDCNFMAYNPYSKKTYALVQSPQIQKEAAAVTIGSNFRIIDCYRGEKTDATHSNIFQQLDVEFADRDEKEIRDIAFKMVRTCFGELKNIDLAFPDVYSYLDLMRIYGTDSPNLCTGLKILEQNGQWILQAAPSQISALKSELTGNQRISIGTDTIRFQPGTALEYVRAVWAKLNAHLLADWDESSLYAYWIVNMPYAQNKNGEISPVHHVMTMPKAAADGFDFLSLSDEKLCELECSSFDLIVCGKYGAVEVLGGDERISSFDLQYDALARLHYNFRQYAYLLETLHFNDTHRRSRLGGFAIGLDRLAMFISGARDMEDVQLFPTNRTDGELFHAIPIENIED